MAWQMAKMSVAYQWRWRGNIAAWRNIARLAGANGVMAISGGGATYLAYQYRGVMA